VTAGLTVGFAAAIFGVLAGGFYDALSGGQVIGDSHLSPAISWERNRSYGPVFALAGALAIGLTFGLAVGLAVGFAYGLVVGVVVGLAAGLAVGLAAGLAGVFLSTEIYPVSLTLAQLAIEWRTPVRLMRFLNDAHRRNVLRAVGPSYQFRHARLQDRLAAAASPRRPSAAAPASTVGSPTHP